MPNSIGSSGIVVASGSEVLLQYTTGYQAIYGTDINLGQETPDGQNINITVQAILDLEDQLVQVNSMFDFTQAIGTILDQRGAYFGVQRAGATFTITPVTLILTQSVNLYGTDQTVQPVYTVSDSAGNQWQLQDTQVGTGPGTVQYSFQAANPGAVLTTPNTITLPVTIVLGVQSINNPTTFTTQGTNEESDAAYKIRLQKSVSLPSQGYLNGLRAALLNIPGVTYASVYENNTGTTDGNGIPGHSIWVIVAGTGSASSIANAIYVKRNAGAGMRGSETFAVTQADGSLFIVKWDDVIFQNLFIEFTATSLNGVNPPNITAILSGLPLSFTPGVGAQVNVNDLSTLVQAIDPNTLVTAAGFSTSLGGSYTPTLSPSSLQQQFVVNASNIVITPMILSPVSSSIVHATTLQFTPLGGHAAYSYAITTNHSGGTIGSSTGLYTAGATTGMTDTITVTDSLSNTATATVAVT